MGHAFTNGVAWVVGFAEITVNALGLGCKRQHHSVRSASCVPRAIIGCDGTGLVFMCGLGVYALCCGSVCLLWLCLFDAEGHLACQAAPDCVPCVPAVFSVVLVMVPMNVSRV